MESGIISNFNIDPVHFMILSFMIDILLLILVISVHMKYNRLKTNYSSFMRGKDGKNLEDSILLKFKELDSISEIAKKNTEDIRSIQKKIRKNYQKVGIVKYDAFWEMGGNLSFALTLLDEENNGWILNSMHSREGCYTYIKEIVKVESYIELAEEEKESLERAIFQEAYDLKDVKLKLK